MSNFQLIYASKSVTNFDFKSIKELSTKAAANNKSLDVTGLLIYGEGKYIQILEGSQEEVNRLFLKISTDKRHADIVLLNYCKAIGRQFPQWNMGCLLLDTQEDIRYLVQKYFEDGNFCPENLSPEQADLFLQEISLFFRKN
ncbi:MAG: BLUF domain-containing protein [Lentisphaeraceae bacterium]|nr:BLUF domain-containing protein [Lentisphaeraceae bacterium]